MKHLIRIAVTLGLGAYTTLAQPPPGGPGGPPGGRGGHGRHHMPPLLMLLDADRDGTLSATEIAGAGAALKTLDQDGDGKLSAAEICPPPPGGTNQFGGTPPAGAKPPADPIMVDLDVNGDDELDATEIENAGTALLQLDTSGDGILTRDELCPKPPQGSGGPGGPDGGPGEPPDAPQGQPQ